jgi:hypothetical protein
VAKATWAMEITGPSGCKTKLKSPAKSGRISALKNDTVPGNDCVNKGLQIVD